MRACSRPIVWKSRSESAAPACASADNNPCQSTCSSRTRRCNTLFLREHGHGIAYSAIESRSSPIPSTLMLFSDTFPTICCLLLNRPEQDAAVHELHLPSSQRRIQQQKDQIHFHFQWRRYTSSYMANSFVRGAGWLSVNFLVAAPDLVLLPSKRFVRNVFAELPP